LPKDFGDWTREKQLRFLIESLDETNDSGWRLGRRHEPLPGESVPPRLLALVRFGEGPFPHCSTFSKKTNDSPVAFSAEQVQHIAHVQTNRRWLSTCFPRSSAFVTSIRAIGSLKSS